MTAWASGAGNAACSRLSRRLSERSSDNADEFESVNPVGERCPPRRLKAGGNQDWLPHSAASRRSIRPRSRRLPACPTISSQACGENNEVQYNAARRKLQPSAPGRIRVLFMQVSA